MMKGKKSVVMAVAAVFAAVAATVFAASALYPATSSMYVSEETFSGEVEEYHYSEKDSGPGYKHTGVTWTSLNKVLAKTTTVAGGTVSDSDGDGTYDTVTIDASNNNAYKYYYLTDDLTADIVISNSSSSSSSASQTMFNLCLNGHALTGTGNGSVISVSAGIVARSITLNILDCGGSGGHSDDVTSEGCYNHYYRYMYDYADKEVGIGVVDGALVPAGYVFYEYVQYEDYYISGNATGSGFIDENGEITDERGYYVLDGEGNRVPVEEEDADGCVRGGLITGGMVSSGGGGINVGSYTTLNMYGGTVAGNWASAGGTGCGVRVASNATFNMYGGTIEGNSTSYHRNMTGGLLIYESDVSAGGVGLVGSSNSTSLTTVFNMYGGEIKNNYTCVDGGGVGPTRMNGAGTVAINMYGGTISGNYSGRYGGGVDCYGALFSMYGGTIRDNCSEEGGGGVEARSSSEIVMTGGTVKGNRALLDGLGGGMYFSGSSSLTLGGSVYIYGNHYGNYLGEYGDGTASDGKTSNIEWSTDWAGGSAGETPVIKLSGQLEEGTRIGISPVTGSSGDVVYRYQIVLDESDSNALSDYVKYFFADGQGWGVRLVTENGEEYLEIYSKR